MSNAYVMYYIESYSSAKNTIESLHSRERMGVCFLLASLLFVLIALPLRGVEYGSMSSAKKNIMTVGVC